MNPFDRRGILWTVDSRIAALLPEASQDFMLHFPGCWVELIQAYRSPIDQALAASAGHSPFDGTKSFSTHQVFPCEGVDLGVYDPLVTGRYVTNGKDYRYSWLGAWAEQHGLRWGGRFVHPRPDPDHWQLPVPNPTAAMVAAGAEAYRAAVTARGVTV